jgi:hypothetical protein
MAELLISHLVFYISSSYHQSLSLSAILYDTVCIVSKRAREAKKQTSMQVWERI